MNWFGLVYDVILRDPQSWSVIKKDGRFYIEMFEMNASGDTLEEASEAIIKLIDNMNFNIQLKV